ncbi:MAG: PqqD family protein [Dehalococcoidia bacterium]|nr:PqqD family protein [Dehalococcoidia bacterium]
MILNGWRTATVLNATAALIWERLEGSASVGQIAARLAATGGVPADLVLAEVLDVVRNVGAIGLLEDVPPPDGLVVTAEPIPRPVAATRSTTSACRTSTTTVGRCTTCSARKPSW